MKLVKFLKVYNKRAFMSDGLFHIIYAEESTCRFFLFASSCDQLSFHSDYHPSILLLNNETDMSNWLHKL